SELGISVQAVICPTCPHSKGENLCPFQQARRQAEKADHMVITAARAASNVPHWAGDRGVVLLVYADPLAVVKPTRDTDLENRPSQRIGNDWADDRLRCVYEAAQGVRYHTTIDEGEPADSKSDPEFWSCVLELTVRADKAFGGGEITSLPLPPRSRKT